MNCDSSRGINRTGTARRMQPDAEKASPVVELGARCRQIVVFSIDWCFSSEMLYGVVWKRTRIAVAGRSASSSYPSSKARADRCRYPIAPQAFYADS